MTRWCPACAPWCCWRRWGTPLLTGGLSEVQNRYAARLAWVLVLTPCLVLAARLPEALPGSAASPAAHAG